MGAKDSFLKRTDLVDRLSAVTASDWFKDCLAYAAADLMEQQHITTEHLAGANKFRNALLSLTIEEELDDVPLPSSGLHHKLDINPIRQLKPEPVKEPTKRRKKKV